MEADQQVDFVKASTALSNALAYLCSNQVRSFYGRALNSMERIPVPGCGTFGVAPLRGRYILVYDPIFTLKIGFEELTATCEHEILHVILKHIPRYIRLRKLYGNNFDAALFEMSSNTAADLAANCVLRKNFPKMSDMERKDLGYWILPEQFEPHLPSELDYETYHKLLVELFKKRLKTPPKRLYEMVKQLLQQQKDAIKQAMSGVMQQPPTKGEEEGEGEGEGEKKEDEGKGQGQGQGEPQQGQSQGQGQGQGQGQPQPGQGSGQGSSEPQMSPEQLKEEMGKLDPVDQLAMKMLMQSMAAHLGWQAGAELSDNEGESHQLETHGRDLIRAAVAAHKKSRGTLPSHIEEYIRKMLQPPTVPWTQFLHNLVQQTRQTKKERGMSRPSKKLAALGVVARKAAKELEELGHG